MITQYLVLEKRADVGNCTALMLEDAGNYKMMLVTAYILLLRYAVLISYLPSVLFSHIINIFLKCYSLCLYTLHRVSTCSKSRYLCHPDGSFTSQMT